jgi:hypothetical protein
MLRGAGGCQFIADALPRAGPNWDAPLERSSRGSETFAESAMGKAKGRQTEANNIGSRPQENRSRAKSEVGKGEERRINRIHD